MSGSLLRERVRGHHARVSFVELFFDLVFVFAITQISHSLLAHLTWDGALQAGLLLMTVWWAWVYTAWVTNWLDPEALLVRLAVFLLMGVGLMMSTSLPQAFAGQGLLFAGAYMALQIGRTLFILWAVRQDGPLRRNFQRVVVWFAASSGLWIAGALNDGSERLAYWAGALLIEYVSPAAAFWVPGLGRTPTADWNVEGAHMAERCGLFVIICLGESILVTGATFAGLELTTATLAAFAVAFVGSVAMWWIYFSAHAEAARQAIADSDDPGRIARLAYTYIHIFVVAGIIVGAAGDELVLAHPGGAVSPATALVLVGGPLLFLFGVLLFKFSVFRVWAASRLSGIAALLGLGLIAQQLTPLALAAAATGVLTAVGVWESLLRIRQARAAIAPA